MSGGVPGNGGSGHGPPGGFGGPPGGFGPPQGGFSPPAGVPGGRPAGSRAFTASEPLQFVVTCLSTDFVALILPLFVVGLISGAISQGATQGARAIAAIVVQQVKPSPELIQLINVALTGSGSLLATLITTFFNAGVMVFSLKVVRGERPGFGAVFAGLPYYLPLLIASFLSKLLIGAGLLLCIVPGIILILGFFVAGPVIVDRQLGPFEGLKESWRLTTGHKVDLLVFGVLTGLLIIVGFLLCCLPGIVVATAPAPDASVPLPAPQRRGAARRLRLSGTRPRAGAARGGHALRARRWAALAGSAAGAG